MATATIDWSTFIPPAEPKRDRYGRYLIVPDSGGKPKAHTRVTTIAETLDDRYNLEAWKQRQVALGLTRRPDLFARVASCRDDDRAALNKLCDDAREAAAASSGANIGTALHRFTERIDLGETVHVPAPWDADIAAWQQAMERSGFHVIPNMVERILVLPEQGVAGMADRILKPNDGGLPKIGDLKTGSTLDFSWGAISIQLALYAHAATIYDPVTQTHQPMPPVDLQHAVVIHLPAGQHTCTLYTIDIEAGWRAAQEALWVRGWRKNITKLATPIVEIATELPAPPIVDLTARRQWLVERVGWLREHYPAAVDKLAANWPNVPTFKSGHQHTSDQLDLISEVLQQAEAEIGVPITADAEPDVAPISKTDKSRLARQIEKLPGKYQALFGEWCQHENLDPLRLQQRDLPAVQAKLQELAVFAAL